MRLAAIAAALLVVGCALPWGRPQQLGLWANGCTWSPDIGGQSCMEHDLSYALGGTDEDRAIADHELALALYSHGHPTEVVEAYFKAVRKYGKDHWHKTKHRTRRLPREYPHGCIQWRW